MQDEDSDSSDERPFKNLLAPDTSRYNKRLVTFLEQRVTDQSFVSCHSFIKPEGPDMGGLFVKDDEQSGGLLSSSDDDNFSISEESVSSSSSDSEGDDLVQSKAEVKPKTESKKNAVEEISQLGYKEISIQELIESMERREEEKEVLNNTSSSSQTHDAARKETSKEQERRIRANSPYGNLKSWRLMRMIVKAKDDVR